MIHALDSPLASRRARRLCAAVAVCAFVACGVLTAERPVCAQGIGQGAPPGAGHAPVPPRMGPPPPRFGHYRTQWRRWLDDDTLTVSSRGSVTPAAPPRVVIPGPRDEQPAESATPPPADRAPAPADPAAASRSRSLLQRWPAPSVSARGTPPTSVLLGDAAAAKRGTAAEQVAFTGRLVPALLAAHDPEARCRIVATAAEFDTPSAIAICTGAMQDPSPLVRMAACSVWAARGGPDAVRLLTERFEKDHDLGVRLRSITSLGEVGGSAAIAVLGKALDNDDPVIRNRALESLVQASGRDFGNDLSLWRAWIADPTDPATRWTLAEGWRRLF